VLPDNTLFIENVSASLFVVAEIIVEHFAQRGAGHLTRGTRNMPLNILGEPDCCHGTEILT
jgi:hypothetical protein